MYINMNNLGAHVICFRSLVSNTNNMLAIHYGHLTGKLLLSVFEKKVSTNCRNLED